jgi:hypothetical protein
MRRSLCYPYQSEVTRFVIIVVTDAEIEQKRQEIQSVLNEDPDAIPPTPKELIALEQAGLTWNFTTGEIELE